MREKIVKSGRCFIMAIAALGVFDGACSSSVGGSTGGGGTTSSGGTSATGGATGGMTASGGMSAAGGESARGGSSALGGATGTGGATGRGGDNGNGGSGGGGATGMGGEGPSSGGGSGADASVGHDGATPGTGGSNSGGSGGQGGGTGGRTSDDASPSTGGAGGGTGYNPCKTSPCIILPLGDSITHGLYSSDDAGYRSQLFKLVVAVNQNVTFVGSLSNGPSTVSGKTFPKNHEGHDGITVTGITGWVPPAKAFIATPHIVLLHIGTNDMTNNADPTTTANQLDTLVTNLVAAAPDALVLVAKIIPLFYTSTTYNNYVAKIPGIVGKHAANGEHVVMVDMTSFPSSDFGNGVHPSDQGYAYMANIWYDAIKGILPK